MFRICLWLVLIGVLSFGCGSPSGPSPAAQPFLVINQSGQLDQELDLFVDTDLQLRNWTSNLSDSLQAAYPAGQQWGFIGAVLRGSTASGSRPGRDLSGYKTLQLDLRGSVGGETVQIGIKDNTDSDDGTETRKTETLSTNWQTLTYALADFRTADLTRLYLLAEVVFNGTAGRTIFVRNVRYVP
jgi:hypothetical protein